MPKIRALIVDDEPIARRGIRLLLRDFPEVEVLRECPNGRDAVKAIRELAPDLVFLDVQMPELDGFQVVEQVGAAHMPAVVFVTAYDQYALKAFEVHALDYVLKPIEKERFRQAFGQAVRWLERDRIVGLAERLEAMLGSLDHGARTARQQAPQRIVVKDAGRIFFLDPRDVDWIDSAGNYLQLHVGKTVHLLRETMNEMERKLEPQEFVRIRRSTLVNVRRIREFRPLFKGAYAVLLRDGTELTSSRRYRSSLDAFFHGRR